MLFIQVHANVSESLYRENFPDEETTKTLSLITNVFKCTLNAQKSNSEDVLKRMAGRA